MGTYGHLVLLTFELEQCRNKAPFLCFLKQYKDRLFTCLFNCCSVPGETGISLSARLSASPQLFLGQATLFVEESLGVCSLVSDAADQILLLQHLHQQENLEDGAVVSRRFSVCTIRR